MRISDIQKYKILLISNRIRCKNCYQRDFIILFTPGFVYKPIIKRGLNIPIRFKEHGYIGKLVISKYYNMDKKEKMTLLCSRCGTIVML
ncbi:MAG: hypothetical protein WC942_01460 [Clostridia bacterium]|jgi:hypothetical protein